MLLPSFWSLRELWDYRKWHRERFPKVLFVFPSVVSDLLFLMLIIYSLVWGSSKVLLDSLMPQQNQYVWRWRIASVQTFKIWKKLTSFFMKNLTTDFDFDRWLYLHMSFGASYIEWDISYNGDPEINRFFLNLVISSALFNFAELYSVCDEI